jgi:hypothetical protein
VLQALPTRSHCRHHHHNPVRVLGPMALIQTLLWPFSLPASQATSRYRLLEMMPKGTEPSACVLVRLGRPLLAPTP